MYFYADDIFPIAIASLHQYQRSEVKVLSVPTFSKSLRRKLQAVQIFQITQHKQKHKVQGKARSIEYETKGAHKTLLKNIASPNRDLRCLYPRNMFIISPRLNECSKESYSLPSQYLIFCTQNMRKNLNTGITSIGILPRFSLQL